MSVAAPKDRYHARTRTAFSPKKGFVPNPLLSKPRNSNCLCGSMKKWKLCCLPTMPRLIPESEIQDHLEMLKEGEPKMDDVKITVDPEARDKYLGTVSAMLEVRDEP